MPLYDFKCKKCGKTFELSLRLAERDSESPKKICPECSSTDVEQLMTFEGGISTGSSLKIADEPPCHSGGCCSHGACPYGGCEE